MIPSYSKILQFGHKAGQKLGDGAVQIEEKVDGSQFSFGILDGELQCRSRGKQICMEAPDKLFTLGVEVVKGLSDKLHPGWIYRGEYLAKPKHNVLAYDRTPKNHIILFDIDMGLQNYIGSKGRKEEAERLGLETVPVIHIGKLPSLEVVLQYLERTSVLGGQLIEGFVIKNYGQFNPINDTVLMCKYVSEKFKEVHQHDRKTSNPNKKDVVEALIDIYQTEARWNKAIQHLRENGDLTETPQDIGNLIMETQSDVQCECALEIKAALWSWAWPQIRRGIIRGLPEWYKKQLLEQFVPVVEEVTDE